MIALLRTKILPLGGFLRDAFEWFTFAREVMSPAGVAMRVAAGAATVALVATPFVATKADFGLGGSTIQVTVTQKGGSAQQVSLDTGNVYPNAFLMQDENKLLLQAIFQNCRSNPKALVEQCNQAAIAADAIRFRNFVGDGKPQLRF